MFVKLLKKYRENIGYTQSDVASKLSVILNKTFNGDAIRSYEAGTNPKIEVIIALAEILEIPEQYLFNDSDAVINKMISKKAPELKSIIEHTLKIPLCDGYVGAGSGGVINNFNDKYVYIDLLSIKKMYAEKTIIALTVIGDSMIPYINSDDIILFHPIENKSYNLNDGKYVIETINGTMVKNLKFKTNGNIIISSCNPAYQSEEINSNESQEYLEILGIVVGRILKS